MITLLHGPNLVSSRSYLLKMKQDYDEVVQVDLKGKSKWRPPASSSLFSQKALIVLENFNSKSDLDTKAFEGFDVVVWVSEIIAKPRWVNKELIFKEADNWSVFKLVDNIFYGQEQSSLKILEKLLSVNTPVEIIIGTLSRQIRNLSLVLNNETEEASKSSFVQTKLKEQARGWTIKKLGAAAKLTLKADWAIKTGKADKVVTLTMLIVQLCSLSKI